MFLDCLQINCLIKIKWDGLYVGCAVQCKIEDRSFGAYLRTHHQPFKGICLPAHCLMNLHTKVLIGRINSCFNQHSSPRVHMRRPAAAQDCIFCADRHKFAMFDPIGYLLMLLPALSFIFFIIKMSGTR